MKRGHPKQIFIRLPLLLAKAVSTTSFATAQGNTKPKNWEDHKLMTLTELNDAQRKIITDAVPDKATAKPIKTRKILVFYRCDGFVHKSITSANFAVQEMGRKTGAFSVDLADEYKVFDAENLKQYDCILLNNTTGMTFQKPSQLNAFMDFVAGGKGLAGFHAASDNFKRNPAAVALVGGQFAGHPWGGGGTWAFKLDDPDHVLNKAFGGQGFWHQDEIYQYQPDSFVGPQKLRVLISLDMNQKKVAERINDGPRDVAVSWIHEAGEGRVFYTNFGHRDQTFHHPVILRHMLDGIQYALGDLEADATPSASAPNHPPALAPANQ